MEKRQGLRIVFFGTPTFAVKALEALLENHFNIVAVVTNVDTISGRGLKTQFSEVKKFALEHNLNLLQPPNLKNETFLNTLKALHADLAVVVAFRMLPQAVWEMPKMGTINIHASLLPNYRGAAPINWAIINGEKITGISTFKLKHEIDTGDILLQKQIEIDTNDTAGSLHDKLAVLGGELIVETLDLLLDKKLIAKPQTFSEHDKKAPKIFKQDCEINWNRKGHEIINFIKGLYPSPSAFTILNEKKYKIHCARFEPAQHNLANGLVESDDKNSIKVSCTDGWVYIDILQAEGKKIMDTASFLRGNKI